MAAQMFNATGAFYLKDEYNRQIKELFLKPEPKTCLSQVNYLIQAQSKMQMTGPWGGLSKCQWPILTTQPRLLLSYYFLPLCSSHLNGEWRRENFCNQGTFPPSLQDFASEMDFIAFCDLQFVSTLKKRPSYLECHLLKFAKNYVSVLSSQ